MSFGEELRLQIEAAFAKRKGTDNSVEYEFKVYKGQTCVLYTAQGIQTHHSRDCTWFWCTTEFGPS